MKENLRAIRRAERERLKDKRAKQWGGWAKDNPKRLGKLVDTPKPCSCNMCGNPRKYFNEETMQERRYKDSAEDQYA
jgi:hypothetical protein